MFAFQPNNTTRADVYPWALDALALPESPCAHIVEIGGSNSGFQFVLSRMGHHLVNVDPGPRARGKGWPVEPAFHAQLNRRFGTRVELRPAFVEQANLPDAAFDRALSISTIEHIPDADITVVLREVRRTLKPGGIFVLTLDLFLDVAPFASDTYNRYGKNVSARWLVETSGLELAFGNPDELFGLDGFNPTRILATRDRYLVGEGYPAMVQLMVLRRPAVPPSPQAPAAI